MNTGNTEKVLAEPADCFDQSYRNSGNDYILCEKAKTESCGENGG